MPWKETTTVEERSKMVEKFETGLYTVSELAEEFGVSRPTVYLWTNRHAAGENLENHPPIAQRLAHSTAPGIVTRLLRAKREKPHWGPRKQRQRLAESFPNVAWPAVSTIGDIYDAHGLVRKRRKRRSVIPVRRLEQVEPRRSGEMMACDHKGWFRLGNSQYCYPLTITDPLSRFIYGIDSLDSTSIARAQPVFVRVFREFGVPERMLSDNGGPFCSSRSLAGLTRLSVTWVKQGIVPIRIRKGCPWENGIHERMHRTLKAETTRPAGKDSRQQQERFDFFREEFNRDRPHEALGGRPPMSIFERCRREYSDRLAVSDVEYPGSYETRRVRSSGEIRWQGRFLFLSEALIGERVGFEETGDGVWTLHFGALEIGRYSERQKALI